MHTWPLKFKRSTAGIESDSNERFEAIFVTSTRGENASNPKPGKLRFAASRLSVFKCEFKLSSSSSDSKYSGLSDNLTVTTIDNDTVGLVLSKTAATVIESGTTDTFTVKLNSEPTDNVTVGLSLNGSDEFSVSDNLSFSSSNWYTAQTVTLTGVNDNVSDDNQTSTLTLSSSSSDSYYNGLSDNVTVTTTDNDTAL